MAFQELVTAAQKHFPTLRIKYKDQSMLMKFMGKLLFFRKDFMTNYTTVFGTTIYIPDEHRVKIHPVSSAVVLMHDLVHLYDQKRVGNLNFQLLYMMPQVLVLPSLLLFLISWKIALPVLLLFLLPIPAYFRMKYEKRAYLSSLYVIQKLGTNLNFNSHLDKQTDIFVGYFLDHSYYFMWPFKKYVAKQFREGVQSILAGNRPYCDDQVFDMLDDLVTNV